MTATAQADHARRLNGLRPSHVAAWCAAAGGLVLLAAITADATGPSVPNPPLRPPAIVEPPTTYPPVVTPPPANPKPSIPTCEASASPSPSMMMGTSALGGFVVPGICGAVPPEYPATPPQNVCSIPAFDANGATRPATTRAPVYLRQGSVVESVVDLRVPGPVQDFIVSRTYSSDVSGSVALGGKWLGNFADRRLVQSGPFAVVLVVNATSQQQFSFVPYPSPGYYTSPGDSPLTLTREAGEKQFVLTNPLTGEVDIFHDFSAGNSNPGRLKERTTLAWRASGREGSQFSYVGSQPVSQVSTPEGQDYNLVFSYTGDLLTGIEVRTGAATSTRIRKVEYLYFQSGTHSPDVAADGDLVQVTLRALRSGGDPGTATDWIARVYQYRYDNQGLLKGVFEPDAIARLLADRADLQDPADILTKGDDDNDSGGAAHTIRDYADRWFTYYTQNLKTDNSGAGTSQDPKCVTVWAPSGENLQGKYGGSDVQEVDSVARRYLVQSETVGGCSSCGSGTGSVQHDYFYLRFDHGTPDPNEVVWLVVEDVSDGQGTGIRRTVYGLNDDGRALRQVTIIDPAGTPQFSCQSWKLETTGRKLNRLAEYRTPAAHDVSSSTVDEFLNPSHNGDFSNDQATLRTSEGLIYVYHYNDAGYQTAELIQRGRSGTAIFLRATDYWTADSKVNRQHLVTAQHQYPQAETNRTAASRITTSYSYTFWGSSDTVKVRTTTLPTVSSGENGSGTATTTEECYDQEGRMRWVKDAAGYVTYTAYHPELGHPAYTAHDVDPSSLPASADNHSDKWTTSSDGSASSNKPTRGAGLPTALALVEFQEYDAQGRVVLSGTEQGGTTLARHYTVYGTHQRLVFRYWDTATNRPPAADRSDALRRQRPGD